MATRFFTQDCREQFSPRELVKIINDIGASGEVIRAIEWDTEADFYGVAITTDPDVTAEQAAELFWKWRADDYNDELLG